MRSERLVKLFQGDENKDRAIALQFSLDGVQTHKTGSNDVTGTLLSWFDDDVKHRDRS